MVCCLDKGSEMHESQSGDMASMDEDCHNSLDKHSKNHENNTDDSSEEECCDNLSLCELPAMQIIEISEINKEKIGLQLTEYSNNFVSNISEPLKEPPESLL